MRAANATRFLGFIILFVPRVRKRARFPAMREGTRGDFSQREALAASRLELPSAEGAKRRPRSCACALEASDAPSIVRISLVGGDNNGMPLANAAAPGARKRESLGGFPEPPQRRRRRSSLVARRSSSYLTSRYYARPPHPLQLVIPFVRLNDELIPRAG